MKKKKKKKKKQEYFYYFCLPHVNLKLCTKIIRLAAGRVRCERGHQRYHQDECMAFLSLCVCVCVEWMHHTHASPIARACILTDGHYNDAVAND